MTMRAPIKPKVKIIKDPTPAEEWREEINKHLPPGAKIHPPLDEMLKDNVNHPAHYTAGKVECIDALEAATDGLNGIEAVCTANAVKYLWRWKRKNGREDLEKARWYIDHLLDHLEGK